MKKFIINMIVGLHAILIMFILFAPLINSNYFLFMHCVIIPFILGHWLLNNDMCALTIIEKNLRKEVYGDKYKEEDCFTCRLIEPVFNFRNTFKSHTTVLYISAIILWLCSSCRLCYKYHIGEIVNLRDLVKK